MIKSTEKQRIRKMKIISKPKGGLDFKAWPAEDVNRWWELIRANHHSAQDLRDIGRLRDKYELERYYLFYMDRNN